MLLAMSAESDTTTPEAEQAAPALLRRTRDDRHAAGVCGGLARYFGLSPTIYRIGFIALAVLGGAGVLLYAIAAVIIPLEGSDESIAEEFLRRHRDRPALLVVLAVLGLIGILVLSTPGGDDWAWFLVDPVWFIALLGAATYLIWQINERERRPEGDAREARTSRSRWLLPAAGALLVIAGLATALDGHPMPVGFGMILVISGAIVLFGALFGRWPALIATIALLIALAGSVVAVADLHEGGGVGERIVRPLTVDQLKDEYRLGIGELELDLGALDLPPGETRVVARLGIGALHVIVPDGVAVDASADVGAGDASVLGQSDDGLDLVERSRDSGFEDATRRLVIDAKVGFGELRIRRAEQPS